MSMMGTSWAPGCWAPGTWRVGAWVGSSNDGGITVTTAAAAQCTGWNRGQYIRRTRKLMDALNSPRWDDVDDISVALGMVHTREWKRILDANQFCRTNTLSLQQDANGQIPFASLDQGTGDSQQRFYRVLWVTNGPRVYDEEKWTHIPTATVVGANNVMPCWFPAGNGATRAIQCIPMESGVTMTVQVNHTPTPIDRLSDDTSCVEFPRDYELILVYEAAAWLLDKGGEESDAGDRFMRKADILRAEMLGDIARVSTSPMRIDYPDTGSQWGSV